MHAVQADGAGQRPAVLGVARQRALQDRQAFQQRRLGLRHAAAALPEFTLADVHVDGQAECFGGHLRQAHVTPGQSQCLAQIVLRQIVLTRVDGAVHALQTADAVVGAGKFIRKLRVARSVLVQAVQKGCCIHQQRLPRLRRAGQVFNLIVVLEDLLVGQLPQLVEALLRDVALGVGHAALRIGHFGLPQRQARAAHHRHQRQCGGGDRRAVALHEALQQVASAGRPRADRIALQVGSDVGGECIDADITLHHRLGQRLEQDVVQVALQPFARDQPGAVLRACRHQVAGSCGFVFQHRACRFHGRGGRASVGPLARQHHVQQHPEAVNVGGGADGFTAHLFGAGVVRGVGALTGGRQPGIGTFQRVDGLGDAKVQQLDVALCGDQHIAGLQIAVHQQVAVRMRHGIRQLQEELQSRVYRKAFAGLVDGPAPHVFHHEVGQTVGRAAGVDEVRDVRVLQPRQRLLLLRKPRQHGHAVHAALEHLHRHLAAVGAISAFGQPHVPHATGTQALAQLPGAQALAFAAGVGLAGQGGGLRQEANAGFRDLVGQQRAHFGHHRSFVRQAGQQFGPLDGPKRQGALKKGAHGVPGRWCHGVGFMRT